MDEVFSEATFLSTGGAHADDAEALTCTALPRWGAVSQSSVGWGAVIQSSVG